MIRYQYMHLDDISIEMLKDFNHVQKIKEKYVKVGDTWMVTGTDEIRQWNLEKKKWVSQYVYRQVERGGVLICAFDHEKLAGFCCVDGYLCGEKAKYSNLTMLFVDDLFQRRGIGKTLFMKACQFASSRGAEKLFISAIPSVETISFYHSMGCRDAEELIREYIDSENDRYLEYELA